MRQSSQSSGQQRNYDQPRIRVCFVTAAVGINTISHGCACGFPAILLPQLKDPGSGFRLTTEEESWIAAMFAVAMLFGNFLTTPISNRLGRKGAHIALTVPYFIGWCVTILATNVKLLIFGRAVLGTAGGLLITLRAVLVGEYTSPKYRGAFLTTISLTQAFGIFFIHLIGSLFSWQVSALICLFFPFTSLLMIIYTPESPSWLAGESRYDECAIVFRWLRGDEEEEELKEMIDTQKELKNLKYNDSQLNGNRLKATLDTIVKKEFYKPIILLIHANITMHFAGGTTMASYSTMILSLIMGPTASVHFWMVFLDTQRIITNTIAIYIIHKVKRRTMLFSSGTLCVISHMAIALYVYGKLQGWMPFEGIWLPALLVNIQFFTVGMAMVPMPNIIAGEVFPLEYRSIGGTISMATGGCVMFLVLKTFPALIDLMGGGAMGLSGTYFVYAIMIIYNLSVMWILLPETKGKTLQQIEDEFRGRPLKAEEIESRLSLHSNPVMMRKLSERKNSVFFE